MKTSIWDILTGVTLLGILCLIGSFGMIMVNPAVPFNPFKPDTLVMIPTLSIPTATPTGMGLPPTWTPTPMQATKEVVAGAATLRSTSTPVPSLTPVILPTFTPSRTPRAAGSAGGKCTVISQTPSDGSFVQKGENFPVSWQIKNSGTKTWASDSMDVRWVSGDSMHISNSVLDMPYDVSPSAMVDIKITMHAPNLPGTYVSNWSIAEGGNSLCRFFIQVNVQ